MLQTYHHETEAGGEDGGSFFEPRGQAHPTSRLILPSSDVLFLLHAATLFALCLPHRGSSEPAQGGGFLKEQSGERGGEEAAEEAAGGSRKAGRRFSGAKNQPRMPLEMAKAALALAARPRELPCRQVEKDQICSFLVEALQTGARPVSIAITYYLV